MTARTTQHFNSKAEKIMDFCSMIKNPTSSTVEFFRHAPKYKKHRSVKPIIKKRISLARELNGVEYINPNIASMIERVKKINSSGARKIQHFINNFTM